MSDVHRTLNEALLVLRDATRVELTISDEPEKNLESLMAWVRDFRDTLSRIPDSPASEELPEQTEDEQELRDSDIENQERIGRIEEQLSTVRDGAPGGLVDPDTLLLEEEVSGTVVFSGTPPLIDSEAGTAGVGDVALRASTKPGLVLDHNGSAQNISGTEFLAAGAGYRVAIAKETGDSERAASAHTHATIEVVPEDGVQVKFGSQSMLTTDIDGVTIQIGDGLKNSTGTLEVDVGDGLAIIGGAVAMEAGANGDIWYYNSGWQRLAKHASNDKVLTLKAGLPSWEDAPGAAHDILSATHTDTLAAAVVAGDIVIGNGTPKWSRLGVGTNGHVLTVVAGAPAWAAATSPTHDILSATHSDTLASAVSQGSLIYGNATPKWAELDIGTYARSLLQVNAAGTEPEWSEDIDIPGTLDVTGVATFDNTVTIGGGNELRFSDAGDSNYVGFEAPALTANQIWVLPSADGAAGQLLKTDGGGNLGWQTITVPTVGTSIQNVKTANDAGSGTNYARDNHEHAFVRRTTGNTATPHYSGIEATGVSTDEWGVIWEDDSSYILDVNGTTGSQGDRNTVARSNHRHAFDGTAFADGTTITWGGGQFSAVTQTHDVLSSQHSDTLAAAVVRGDLIYGNSTPKWARLGIGTYARSLLQVNAGGTEPEWTEDVDIPGTLDVTGATVLDSTLQVDGLATLNSHVEIRSGSELRFYDVGNSNYVGFEAPALAANQIWILPSADGNPNDVLTTDGGGNLSWAAAGGTHDILSATHTDTLAAAVVAGDLIIGNATPKWSRLGIGSEGQFLVVSGGAPAWATKTIPSKYTSIPESVDYDTVGAAGSSDEYSPGDHKHPFDGSNLAGAGLNWYSSGGVGEFRNDWSPATNAPPVINSTTSTLGIVAAKFAREDHNHGFTPVAAFCASGVTISANKFVFDGAAMTTSGFGIGWDGSELTVTADLDWILQNGATATVDITFNSGIDLIFNTTTGTMLGTAANQKVAFHGATPVVQASHIADPAGGGTQDAEARTAINAILVALENKGILASA